jgi:hypothetical protein
VTTTPTADAEEIMMSTTQLPPADPRLQLLLDKDELRELTFMYAHRIVTGDARGIANLFTEDGVLDYADVLRLARPTDATEPQWSAGSDLVFTGRQAICEFVPSILNLQVKAYFTNHIFRVTGDTAVGVSFYENRLIQRGASVMGAGRMFDEFQRVDGRWLISYRRQALFYFTGLHESWAREMDPSFPQPIVDKRGWESALLAGWGAEP